MKEEKDDTEEGFDKYDAHDFLQIKSFLANSWVELPDRTSASRILRPRFVMRSVDETDRKAGSDETPSSLDQGTKYQKEIGEKDGEEDERLGGKAGTHDEHTDQKRSESDAGKFVNASAAYASKSFPFSIITMN